MNVPIPIARGLSVRIAIHQAREPVGYQQYPVVAITQDGKPVYPILGKGGRFAVPSDDLDYLLAKDDGPMWGLVAANLPTTDEPDPHAIVEVIPGHDHALAYKLPDGSTHTGVIPLWGRRADGTVVPLLHADTVPTVSTINRDDEGVIISSTTEQQE